MKIIRKGGEIMTATSKLRGYIAMPVLILGLAAGIGGCSSQTQPSSPAAGNPSTEAPKTVPTPQSETNIIVYSSDGTMTPQSLNIKAGDTVTWTNNDTKQHWPATAAHPTHTVYPGSGIEKCGTSEQNKIFDACKGIEPGGNFSFTFTEKGEWRYHDHLNVTAPYFGTINVQ